MKNVIVFAFVSLLVNSTLVLGDDNTPPKYPWHLVNFWWDCKVPNEEFNSVSIEFKVDGKIAKNDFIFIAPIGLAKINETSLYGGIQTNTGGWRTKFDKAIAKVGQGGIFSRWADNNQPLKMKYANGDNNTLYEAALYEGSFISVRKKIPWTNGIYKFEIRKILQEVDDDPHAWYGAYLYDAQSKVESSIGLLRFDGLKFKIDKSIASFVEVYSGDKSSIPEMKISFMSPKINEKSCGNNSVFVVYPSNGFEPFTRFARAFLDNEWVVSNITSDKVPSDVKEERLMFHKK